MSQPPTAGHSRLVVVTALGITQILGWGSTYYLPAVLAVPIVQDTGWALDWVVGGLSIGLLIAGLISPRVGHMIDQKGGRPVMAASALLFAAGLLILGLAPSLPVFIGGWVVIGVAMGGGYMIRPSPHSVVCMGIKRAAPSPMSPCMAASPVRCAGRSAPFC
jgi:MFS family permease